MLAPYEIQIHINLLELAPYDKFNRVQSLYMFILKHGILFIETMRYI
jgi:Tfp pilus assembly protein PilZ